MRLLLLILLLFAGGTAQAEITVEDAWVRATPPGARTAAVYLTLHNAGGDDALIGAASPAAEETQLHTHVHEQGMMRMEQVARFDLPSGSVIKLEAGGKHLMFIDIYEPMMPGTSVEITLLFEQQEALLLAVPVRDARKP